MMGIRCWNMYVQYFEDHKLQHLLFEYMTFEVRQLIDNLNDLVMTQHSFLINVLHFIKIEKKF